MKSRIEKLEENITALKKQLLELGPIHPGSLSKQIRKKNGEPYGEYWHLSYTFAGKGRTVYVPTPQLQHYNVRLKNFQRFRLLSDKIIELSIELSKLSLEAD